MAAWLHLQDRVKKTGALALVLAAEHGQLEVHEFGFFNEEDLRDNKPVDVVVI